MATIVAAAGAAGNWTAGGSWVGGVAPTAADDAQVTVTTTSLTIDSGAVCRSADFTGCTGTITHTAGINFLIGDATAGASNIALKMVSGMTYSTSNDTCRINFVSTSTTQQTVDFGGKQPGNVEFNGVGGKWALTTGVTSRSVTAFIALTSGTLETDGISDNSALTHSWGIFSGSTTSTRVLTMGASNITLTSSGNAFQCSDTTNLTVTAGTYTITLSGASPSFLSSNGGGSSKTYNSVSFTGSGVPVLSGSSTFGTLIRTGTASKVDYLQLNSNQTVTGTLTLNGNSTVNRILVFSNTLGTPRTITTTSATVTSTNTDFRDITLSVTKDLSAQTDIGDCGGNSGITFPASATQTWSGTSGGNWSANAWSGRVPLPQDDVTINAAFSASQSVAADMPRLGKSISWTGATGSPTWTLTTIANTNYGSITLITGMTFSNSQTFNFEGRGSFTLTNAGKTWGGNISVNISMIGGTLLLQDASLFNASSGFLLIAGTLNLNGFNYTAASLNSSGSLTRNLILGSGIITLSGTVIWTGMTGVTLTSTGSTIFLSDTSASSKTFAGLGFTYNDLKIAGGGAGAVIITGANTFNRIYTDGAGTKTITLPGSTTTTIVSGLGLANGTNVITFTASAGSATVSKSGGGTVSWDYVSLTNIPATQATTWYAGTHSTDGGGNTNWLFIAAPSGVAGGGTANLVYSAGPPFNTFGFF